MSYLVTFLLSLYLSVGFCEETTSTDPLSFNTDVTSTSENTPIDEENDTISINEITTSATNITISWASTGDDTYTLYLESIESLYFYNELNCVIDLITKNITIYETEYTFTDLYPYFNYSIKIENAVGSSETFYVETNQTTPGPVVNLTVINRTISWDLPCDVNGDLKSFFLIIKETDTSENKTIDKIDDEINYKQEFNWKSSMFYTIEVRAVLENDIEGISSFYSFNTSVPGRPQQITIKSNETSFSVSWTEPEDPNGEILNYKLELIDYGPIYVLGEDCSQTNSTSTNYTNDLSYTFDDLMPYYNYSVRIQAENFAGYGEVAEEVAQTAQAQPSQIRDLNVSLTDSSTDNQYIVSMIITWSAPCEINGDLENFSIKINDEVKYVEYHPENMTYNIEESNLSPFSNYTVQVAALLTNEMSSEIVETSIFTPEFIPDTVNDIEVNNITSNSFYISWKEPVINGELTNYNITLNNLGPLYKIDNSCEIFHEAHYNQTIDTEYIFEDLLPFYQYSVDIRACTKIGCSLNVNETLVNTSSSIPEEPANLQSVTISEIITIDEYTVNKSIIWNNPCMQNGQIDHYDILISSVYTENEQLFNITTENISYDEIYEINLLVEPSRTYLISVRAVLENNETGVNANTTFTTPVGFPSTVTIRNSSINPSSLEISWDEPKPEVGKIESYKLVLYDYGPQYNIFDDSSSCEQYNKNETFNDVVNRYYTFENLMSFYGYGYQISARTSAGFGPPTDIIRFNTTPSVPDVVRSFTAIVDNSTKTANLSWYIPCLINGELQEFLLFINQENKNITQSQNIAFENDAVKYVHTLTNLEMGTKYNLYISVVLSNGYKSEYVSLSFSLPEEDDPSNLIIILLSTLIPITLIAAFIAFILWRKKSHFGYCPIGKISAPNSIQSTPKPSKTFLDRDILISKYQSYYKKLMENPYLLKEQYNLINEECKTFDVTYNFALKPENRRKNRYVNILPYDSTRVRLNMDEDDEISSDYINASYIKGYSGAIEYIATQGPLKLTSKDFWNMIIDENVTIIAMVAQFYEQNKEKCHKYLPNNFEQISLGPDFKITCETELLFSSYSVRTILIQKGDSKHHITHFQYLEWPDFGVPSSTESLLFFCHKVRERVEFDGGLIAVHCSAGVGRTGTLIAIDILLQMLKRENKVNIYKVVLDLRKQRTKMVQAEAQYVFIHTCISDYLENPSIEDDESMYENLNEPIYENLPAHKEMIAENVL